MLMPVLSTKLYIQEMRDNRVLRKTLVEKISSYMKSTKLTLVSAPAGYGKTTFAIELINSLQMASSWISLDESDNELSQFLMYLIAALKKAGVNIGIETENLALDLKLSSTQAPITMVINDIAALSKKIVLVLDDFHLISSPQVYNAVKFLLAHQPPNFHLIIITREDPDLPVSYMRSKGEITEVRMEDLCFTAEETEEFLKGVMGLKLNSEMVGAVASRTEGWAAGLQLVGLSLNGCDEQDIDEFIKVFKDTHRYIIDYLVEEVINRQSDKIREFLCKTSILDRMNGPLCSSVTGMDNCRQLLYTLEKANIFLIPLDSKREWFRYHHLFADSLRLQLTEKEEHELHKKAALWFWDNGFKQEAVKHALRSRDMSLSIKLIEDSTEDAFKYAQLSTLVNWLNSIPEYLVKKNEILSVRKAWALYLTGKANEAVQYLDSLGEDFFEKTTPHNKGLILSLKATIPQQGGQDDPEFLAEEALKFLEPWDPIARISSLNTLGRIQEDRGKTSDANKTFRAAYGEALKLGCTLITTVTLKNLGTNLNAMGNGREAVDLYTLYIDRMMNEYGKVLPFIGIIYLGLAELHYYRNELAKAKDYMEKGMELCRSISYPWALTTTIMDARIRFASGEKEAAINSMEQAVMETQNKNIPRQAIGSIAVLTELLLRDGNVKRALEFEKALKNHIESMGKGTSWDASLACARILIYKRAGSEAFELLASLEEEAIKSQRLREQITVYILYAESYYSDGDYANSDSYLDKAVELAEMRGYCRLFLEDEELIKDVLLHRRKEMGQFLHKIAEYLNLSYSEGKTPAAENIETSNLRHELPGGSLYIESLSKRETEILKLIAAGMSTNEIAKELYISTNTAQWHISNIYSKLGTKNRAQAINKARELGII